MVLSTPVRSDATITVIPIPAPASRAAITMLLARNEISPHDADLLATNPSALDELMTLCLLRDRNDLTDADFRHEKGEILRQATLVPA